MDYDKWILTVRIITKWLRTNGLGHNGLGQNESFLGQIFHSRCNHPLW
jgi:hypothetical protein